jgi:hypothetical protein
MKTMPVFCGDVPPKEELEEFSKVMDIGQLADHYDTYERKVFYWLNKYNLKAVPRVRGGSKKIDFDFEYVKRCISYGLGVPEIAKMVHVSPVTIHNRLKDDGLTINDLLNPGIKGGNADGYDCKTGIGSRHDCVYWNRNCHCCDYLGATGHRRPCPAYNCTVYKKKVSRYGQES